MSSWSLALRFRLVFSTAEYVSCQIELISCVVCWLSDYMQHFCSYGILGSMIDVKLKLSM